MSTSQPSVSSLRVEKPGKSKFAPTLGGAQRRNVLARDAATEVPHNKIEFSETTPAEDVNIEMHFNFVDETPKVYEATVEAKRIGGVNVIEGISARRRERRGSISTELSGGSVAATLANTATEQQQQQVTMSHFLTDTGKGIPMSVSSLTGSKNKNIQKTVRMVKTSLTTAIVPQVRVVNGEIVVDEMGSINQESPSTTTAVDRSEEVDVINEENERHLTSHSFVKSIGSNRWNTKDTELFYDALSMCGTDFSLISMLFPNRTREQVKGKYKVEERKNPTRVAMSLRNKKPLDTCLLINKEGDPQ